MTQLIKSAYPIKLIQGKTRLPSSSLPRTGYLIILEPISALEQNLSPF